MSGSEMTVAALLALAYQSGANRDCPSAYAKLAEARTAIEALPLELEEVMELKARVAEVDMYLAACCDSSLSLALESIISFLRRDDVGLERKLSEVQLALREFKRRLAKAEL